MLLCYEVTRDLPLDDVEIETPLARMKSPRIAGKKLVFAPILRAGVTFVGRHAGSGAGGARCAYRALSRSRRRFVAVEYFFKAPSDLAERLVIVDLADARDRKHGGGGDRPAEGARRERHPVGLPARRAGGLRARARRSSRRADLDGGDRRGARRARLHSSRPRRCRRPRIRDQMNRCGNTGRRLGF